MLKKLTALSLSLLICLSLLPCQAGAMDAPEDEQPIQAEDMENLGSSENGGADAAPDRVTAPSYNDGGGDPLPHPGNIIGGGDQNGTGASHGVKTGGSNYGPQP